MPHSGRFPPPPPNCSSSPTVGENKCTRVPSSSLGVRLLQEGTNNLPHQHFREKIKDCFRCLLPYEGNLIWVRSWSTTAAFFTSKMLPGLNQGGSWCPIEKWLSVQQTNASLSQRDTLCLMGQFSDSLTALPVASSSRTATLPTVTFGNGPFWEPEEVYWFIHYIGFSVIWSWRSGEPWETIVSFDIVSRGLVACSGPVWLVTNVWCLQFLKLSKLCLDDVNLCGKSVGRGSW